MGPGLSHPLIRLLPRYLRILLVGLDGAGKTTILYKLKMDKNVDTNPTIGFNLEDVTSVKNVTLRIYDVGGQENIRQLWGHYYRGSEGIIFVVDAADISRITEAREELFSVLRDDQMEKGVPVVILANKQDLTTALKSHELIDKMRLWELQSNSWYVQEVSATTGDGLDEGINMMADMVKTFQMGKGVVRN